MIIDGKQLKVYYEEIPVSKIEYDPENPRRYEIGLELQTKGLPAGDARRPEGIEMATRFHELVESIVENRGISMPLVVERNDSKNILIDGDRRLGAVKYILRNKEILDGNEELKNNLAELPCIVVEGPLTETERLRILSHIHVHLTDWRPAAKDYVIEKLIKTVGEEKARTLTRATVGSIEKGRLVEEYKKRFSFKGAQAVSWAKEFASIKQSLVDGEVVNATVDKAKDGKITSAVHLRELRKILKNPDARAEYLKPESTIEDAKRVKDIKEFSKAIDRPDVPFKDYVEKLLLALRNIKFEELLKYKGDQEVVMSVEECITLLNKFKVYI